MVILVFVLQLLLISVLVYGTVLRGMGRLPPCPKYILPIIVIVLLILCISSVIIVWLEHANRLLIRQREAELVRLKHIEDQNQAYRRHRHDLYNHLTVISGLAQLGKVERLMAYLDAYLRELNFGMFNISSGMEELDVLLHAKLALAQRESIAFSLHCLEPFQCNQTRIVDIISILANAMDNAIQAAADAKDKNVGVTISRDSDKWVFEIVNTYDPSINLDSILKLRGFSTKSGGQGGQGLPIIHKTVRKLQGMAKYSVGKGICRLRIEIPNSSLEIRGKLPAN